MNERLAGIFVQKCLKTGELLIDQQFPEQSHSDEESIMKRGTSSLCPCRTENSGLNQGQFGGRFCLTQQSYLLEGVLLPSPCESSAQENWRSPGLIARSCFQVES
jgi:hypothetical protein